MQYFDEPHALEDVPQAELNAPVLCLHSAFVQKRGRVVGSIWDSPISAVCRVEKVCMNLERVAFTDPRVLNETKVQAINPVCA